MNQRGQSLVEFGIGAALLAIIVVAVMTLLVPGMQHATRSITITTEKEYVVELTEAETLAVATQKIVASRHAIERHGADAIIAVECFNNRGTWRVYRIGNQEFHLLCMDMGGEIRDVILKRRTNTSKEFDFATAYSPKDGVMDKALNWLLGKGAQLARLPQDFVIYVDGIIP